MHLNDLPDDCLIQIFLRLPAGSLLAIQATCTRWIEPLSLACRQVKRLSLLGSEQMYLNSSTMCPLYLLQTAYLQYGITIHSAFHHVTLRQDSLTSQTVTYLLDTFPHVEHLELVQIALDRNLTSISTLLTGFSTQLNSLSIYHERDHEFTYWEHASTRYSLGHHPRSWARRHLRDLINSPNALLSQLSLELQPNLKHLTVVDLTMYLTQFRAQATLHPVPDMSHLEQFHLVRPFDSNELLNQVATITQPWANLKALTLESKRLDMNNHLLETCNFAAVGTTLSNLTNLTISGLFPAILPSLIRQFCTSNLTYLHLHDIKLPLPEMLQDLADLQALHHLRIFSDVAIVTSQWNNKAQQSSIQLPQIQTLQLENCDVIHQPEQSIPVLRNAFPQLQHLILHRDSRMLGTLCLRCSANGIYLDQFCKRNLIRAVSGARRGSLGFEKLQQIKVHVKEYFQGDEHLLIEPPWLDQYQVWNCQKQEWSLETVRF